MNKLVIIGALVVIIAAIGFYMMAQPSEGTGSSSEEMTSIEESLNALEASELTSPNFSEIVPENLS